MVLLVTVVMVWVAIFGSSFVASAVRLFLTTIVGTTAGDTEVVCVETLVVSLVVGVAVAFGLGEAVGVGVEKESTSSSFGETDSCLVISLGKVLLDRV